MGCRTNRRPRNGDRFHPAAARNAFWLHALGSYYEVCQKCQETQEGEGERKDSGVVMWEV